MERDASGRQVGSNTAVVAKGQDADVASYVVEKSIVSDPGLARFIVMPRCVRLASIAVDANEAGKIGSATFLRLAGQRLPGTYLTNWGLSGTATTSRP